MHFTTFLPALLGLAAAVPYNDMADSPEAAMAAANWFGKRQGKKATPTAAACKTTPATACTSAPTGFGPTASPDSVPAFKNNGQISKMAAQADTPQSYVQIFQNQDAAANASNYITFFNFQSYDTKACAAKCDQTSGCGAFNLYFERNPTLSTDPLCCPNPQSMTNIKCALWGSTFDKKSAANKGQFRNSFEVVMAGSNGYNRVSGTSTSRPASTSATRSSVTSSSEPVTSDVVQVISTPSSFATSASGKIQIQDNSTLSSANVQSETSSAEASTTEPAQASFAPAFATLSNATSDMTSTTTEEVQASSAPSSAGPAIVDLPLVDTTITESSVEASSAETTASEAPSSTEDVQVSATPSSTEDIEVSATPSSASPPSDDFRVAATMTADSSTQSDSAQTTAPDTPPSTDDSSSSSKTFLSSTDEVQPITGTEPGSPVTATAETSSASTGCATPVATPAITFNLNKTAVEGENIFMYGSIDQLGNWQVEKSYPLTAYYFIENGRNTSNWYGTIEVEAGTFFEYKYFQRNADYSISWANPPNMRYTVPTGCETLIVQSDEWPGTQDDTSSMAASDTSSMTASDTSSMAAAETSSMAAAETSSIDTSSMAT